MPVLVNLLIYFVIAVIIFAVAFYCLRLLPAEVQNIGRIVLYVVAAIVVIILLLQLVNGGGGALGGAHRKLGLVLESCATLPLT